VATTTLHKTPPNARSYAIAPFPFADEPRRIIEVVRLACITIMRSRLCAIRRAAP
jgi:hypothetical protein